MPLRKGWVSYRFTPLFLSFLLSFFLFCSSERSQNTGYEDDGLRRHGDGDGDDMEVEMIEMIESDASRGMWRRAFQPNATQAEIGQCLLLLNIRLNLVSTGVSSCL